MHLYQYKDRVITALLLAAYAIWCATGIYVGLGMF